MRDHAGFHGAKLMSPHASQMQDNPGSALERGLGLPSGGAAGGSAGRYVPPRGERQGPGEADQRTSVGQELQMAAVFIGNV